MDVIDDVEEVELLGEIDEVDIVDRAEVLVMASTRLALRLESADWILALSAASLGFGVPTLVTVVGVAVKTESSVTVVV